MLGEHLFCQNVKKTFSVVEPDLTLTNKGLINYWSILFIVVLTVKLTFC